MTFPREGKIDLHDKMWRFSTFKNWPGKASVVYLSSRGIFYTGCSQDVRCCRCFKETSLEQNREFLVDRQLLHYKGCAWASEFGPKNEFSYNIRDLKQSANKAGSDENSPIDKNPTELGALACCSYEHCRTHRETETTTTGPFSSAGRVTRNGYINTLTTIQTSSPEMPQFATIDIRLASFLSLNETRFSSSIERMTKAGFYTKDNPQFVYCFYCGLGLRTDVEDFDPWVDHARWVPTCPYVLSEKGKTFVHSCLEKTVTEIVTGQQVTKCTDGPYR